MAGSGVDLANGEVPEEFKAALYQVLSTPKVIRSGLTTAMIWQRWRTQLPKAYVRFYGDATVTYLRRLELEGRIRSDTRPSSSTHRWYLTPGWHGYAHGMSYANVLGRVFPYRAEGLTWDEIREAVAKLTDPAREDAPLAGGTSFAVTAIPQPVLWLSHASQDFLRLPQARQG